MYKQQITIAEYEHSVNGTTYPKVIRMRDGRLYKIDEVLGIEFSLSNEYDGYRYKVRIGDVTKNIYNHNSHWYIIIPEIKDRPAIRTKGA